jgi:hypothetical protein
MSDAEGPPWFAPDHVVRLNRSGSVDRPRKALWTLVKAGKRVDAELMFHGESYGWEARFLHDGQLAYGRRFVLRADELQEADEERTRLLAEGWSLDAP